MGQFVHWDYYLVLEQDFLVTNRYVEVDRKNYKTYSIAFVHLLLAIGSECDAVAKRYCVVRPQSKCGNIDQWRAAFLADYPALPDIEVWVPRYQISSTPWTDWGGEKPKNPTWWRAYNNVKHHRAEYFASANLENVLDGLLGLYVLLQLTYRMNSEHLQGSFVGNWAFGSVQPRPIT